MTKPKYPLFFKAADIEEKTFALIFVESENKFTTITHTANKFIIDTVATWEDVRMSIGGKILPIEPSEYNKTLFDDWNIDLKFADQLDAEDAAPVVAPSGFPPVPGTSESVEQGFEEPVENEGEVTEETAEDDLPPADENSTEEESEDEDSEEEKIE